jgi:hypothetical protein
MVSAACLSSEESSLELSRARLVYGDDDRQEVYRVAKEPSLYQAARAVAAVIPRSRLRYTR